MKKYFTIILMILVLCQIAFAINQEQRLEIRKSLKISDNGERFRETLNVLDENNVDLTEEKEIASEIRDKAKEFDVNINDYENIVMPIRWGLLSLYLVLAVILIAAFWIIMKKRK